MPSLPGALKHLLKQRQYVAGTHGMRGSELSQSCRKVDDVSNTFKVKETPVLRESVAHGSASSTATGVPLEAPAECAEGDTNDVRAPGCDAFRDREGSPASPLRSLSAQRAASRTSVIGTPSASSAPRHKGARRTVAGVPRFDVPAVQAKERASFAAFLSRSSAEMGEAESPSAASQRSTERQDTAPTEAKRESLEVTESEAVVLGRKYNFHPAEVRECLREFRQVDREKRGRLNHEEFLGCIKNRLALTEDEEIPESVLQEVWHASDNEDEEGLDFEEYLRWVQSVAFSEHMVASSPKDKLTKTLALMHGIAVADVERVRSEYDRHDIECRGVLFKDEFEQLLLGLLRAKLASDLPKQRLDFYWVSADVARNGRLDFKEFFSWYIKQFGRHSLLSGDASLNVYANLGCDRFACLEPSSVQCAQRRTLITDG